VWLGSIACVLAAAALVAVVVALVTGQREPAPIPQPEERKTVAEVFDESADRSLCEAIAPLMRESDDRNHALTTSGEPGSPGRSGAIPKHKTDTVAWASRMPQTLEAHAEPSRYLTRTLQAYVDGELLYSENIYPNRAPDSYDSSVWDSKSVNYGGPLGACYKVGVRW
jgi:hypothetical protein